MVINIEDANLGLKGYIAIHRKNDNVPSFGATRFWSYTSQNEALEDSLRLSKMMSYKAALAGLPCGGAKAVVIKPKGKFNRNELLTGYARQLNHVSDLFVTGTDVGLFPDDLILMNKHTSNLVGLKGDPTLSTASGVVYSMQVCLKKFFGRKGIKGRSIAIQGLGKVGLAILSLVYKEMDKVYVSEIDEETLREVLAGYPKVTVVDHKDIHKQNVDVFCPCALSHSLNSKTIQELKCQIIVGAANNQLSDSKIGSELHKKNIIYAPDYLVNAGGLIDVYCEYDKQVNKENSVSNRVRYISKILEKVIKNSTEKNLPTNIVANEMAEKIFNGYGK